MIWLVAALAAPPPPAPPPEEPEEIVVTAERVRGVGMVLTGTPRAPVCTLDRSSGDPRLDALACERLVACTGPHRFRRRALMRCVLAGIPEMRRRLAAAP